MSIKPKEIVTKIKPYVMASKKHRVVIGVIGVIILYGWLIFQINILSSYEPTDEDVTAKLQKVKRPIIDEEIVKKIESLQDENIEVQAVFKQARENPFQE